MLPLFVSCNSFEREIENAIENGEFEKSNSLIKTIVDTEKKGIYKKSLTDKYLEVKEDSITQWRENEALYFVSNTGEELHQKGKMLVELAQTINLLKQKDDFRLEIYLDRWDYQYKGILSNNMVLMEDADEFMGKYGYLLEELENLPQQLISNNSSENEIAKFFVQKVLQADERVKRVEEPVALSIKDLNFNYNGLGILDKLDRIRKNQSIIKAYYESHKREFKVIAEYNGIILLSGPENLAIQTHSDGSIGYSLLTQKGNVYYEKGSKFGNFYEIRGKKILEGDEDGYVN